MAKSIFFYILIRSWNSFEHFDKCIDSVLSQDYLNYKILFVDDASDYTKNQKKYIKRKLLNHKVVFNSIRKYSLGNSFEIIHKYAKKDDAIIFNLDGDDWLLPNALNIVANVYQKHQKCQLTYGQCLIWDGDEIYRKSSRYLFPRINTRYPKQIEKHKSYRLEPFRPLHPRTWKVSLFKSISKKEFLDSRGKWLRFPEDQAMFYPMLEKINDNYIVIKKSIYVYNMANAHSIIKEYTIPTVKEEIDIRKKHSSIKKYILGEKKINVYHHKTLSLPIVSDLLYILQIKLLENDLSNTIVISLKNSILRNKLLNLLKNSTIIVVKTPKLYNLLKNFHSYKIFDCPPLKLSDKTIDYLYQVMWTLVYCDAVTKNTKRLLNSLIPNNYPTINI